MLKVPLSKSRYSWLYFTAYLTLVVVAAAELFGASLASTRWAMAGLLIAFGLVLAVRAIRVDGRPPQEVPAWQTHLYLAVQCLLVAGLLALRRGDVIQSAGDHALTTPLLFCILCVQAVLALPLRTAIVWIAVFTLVTASLFCTVKGLGEGFLTALPYTIGFIFSGAFAYGLTRAEAAQRESLILLEELRKTYKQLQEYAAKAEELAVSEERNRLAREMHDELGHRLTVAAVQLEAAQRLIDRDPDQASHIVGTVRQQVLAALSGLRRTVATLRTPLEEDLSLSKALARLAADFEQATGITIHPLLPDDIPALPDSHRLGLYRVAQEALTNIQRHAKAKEAWLQLTLDSESATLLVRDNGVGLPQGAMQSGFGLRGLQERATQLGGKLLLETSPDGGAQVRFDLPLPKEYASG